MKLAGFAVLALFGLWLAYRGTIWPSRWHTGFASFYGLDSAKEGLNERTACGARFSPREFAAASWQFPCFTWLRVERLDTRKSVRVVVWDKGPALWTGRQLDLTPTAFSRLDALAQGVIPVRYRIDSP